MVKVLGEIQVVVEMEVRGMDEVVDVVMVKVEKGRRLSCRNGLI